MELREKSRTDVDLSVPERIADGIRQYASGNILAALWDFFEAASEDPGNPLNHYLCGLALQALGLDIEARDEWQEVVALTRSSPPDSPASADQPLPPPTCQWVRGMAQQLLTQHPSDADAQYMNAH